MIVSVPHHCFLLFNFNTGFPTFHNIFTEFSKVQEKNLKIYDTPNCAYKCKKTHTQKQRTNNPDYAHLITGPILSTKTKFRQI